jgi:hypothetical protein
VHSQISVSFEQSLGLAAHTPYAMHHVCGASFEEALAAALHKHRYRTALFSLARPTALLGRCGCVFVEESGLVIGIVQESAR